MEDCFDLLTQEIESLDIANPVAYGPIIDPQRKGARMICNMPGCYRKSVENFYFTSFYCHAHGSEIPERLRLDCIAENCVYSTYRILYPNENNDTFLCENHHRHHKSTVFQSRFRVQSNDFVLKAGDCDMVLISGLDFDQMAFDYSYSSEIKDHLRQIIQSYVDSLCFESPEAVVEKHSTILRGLDAFSEYDAIELRKIHTHYRDLLARGYVYMVLYSNEGTLYSDKISIKIGYTSNIERRIEQYTHCKRDMYHDVLAQVPGPSRVPWYSKDKTEPLLGVYLLEQIFHAIFVQRQRARECSCGVTHGEVFDFDAVYGIRNELDAAKIRVHDLLEQMDKWADIIREAEKSLEIARNVHRPILDKITRKLHMTGKKVYPDYMWGFTRGY